MLPRRLFAALLAGLLSLQLVAAGTSGACPMVESMTQVTAGQAGSPDVEPAMAGMTMAPSGAIEGSPRHDDENCDHQAAERCRLMASCAAGFIVPAFALATAPAAGHDAVISAVATLALSVSSPPELPPPRA